MSFVIGYFRQRSKKFLIVRNCKGFFATGGITDAGSKLDFAINEDSTS